MKQTRIPTLYLGDMKIFADISPNKPQVMKIMEEAAEVYSAWENTKNSKTRAEASRNKELLLHECADVIQAVSNLIYSLGVKNFVPYLDDCEYRNQIRGRYPQVLSDNYYGIQGIQVRVVDESRKKHVQ